MDTDKTVRNALLDTMLNQVESGEPPEARETYERLMARGMSQSQALQHMAAVLREEMNRMLADSRPFDNARFAAALRKIPTEV